MADVSSGRTRHFLQRWPDGTTGHKELAQKIIFLFSTWHFVENLIVFLCHSLIYLHSHSLNTMQHYIMRWSAVEINILRIKMALPKCCRQSCCQGYQRFFLVAMITQEHPSGSAPECKTVPLRSTVLIMQRRLTAHLATPRVNGEIKFVALTTGHVHRKITFLGVGVCIIQTPHREAATCKKILNITYTTYVKH